MSTFAFTAQQRQAIETIDRSVIVSAGAGSGKTAVLAQRCAYLVCDAPPPYRCDVDRLLVLTFTEAAAAEMRSRIVAAIRQRAADRPHDQRLRRQVTLVDYALISTIHSFCLWLIRRHFNELDMDPAASVVGAEEARVLRHDVLEALLQSRYEAGDTAFTQLIDVYGEGEDRGIGALVLRLADFLASVPHPEDWLEDAIADVDDRAPHTVIRWLDKLPGELKRLSGHAADLADAIRAKDPIGHVYADALYAVSDQLNSWQSRWSTERCAPFESATGDKDAHLRLLATADPICAEIRAYAPERPKAPRLSKEAPPETKATRDAASKHFSEIKALITKRICTPYALFSTTEWTDALRQTAPFVRTVVDLVRAFQDAWTARKRRIDVLEFADLERLAFTLLTAQTQDGDPSPVVTGLHDRFAHVLVDEFQDINPLQQAIVCAASRESTKRHSDNLFVVGDVKQSIYRFRLAEPSIFLDRLHRFRQADTSHSAIALQKNFRSRPTILEAVNVVFRKLMAPGNAAIEYDELAELIPGRTDDQPSPPQPVELHLIDRAVDRGDTPEDESSEQESGITDAHDPTTSTPIEREAWLIGNRIRAILEEGSDQDNPPTYADIAILLRATQVNASSMLTILSGMGIPVHAGAGGSLLEAREVRDVLAALQVLDNMQQDIPLASVLRNGVFGASLSDSDLYTIRQHDRSVPFHVVVRRFALNGPDTDLRNRLNALLHAVARFREIATRKPVPELIGRLYAQGGYLAHVGGLPGGQLRRANLTKFLQFAKSINNFRQQGLGRFLTFVADLAEHDERIAAASPGPSTEGAVRIMSVHQSKGLEFPIVFVAGLGTRFNLGDRSGRMLFERTAKIGFRAVDPAEMIEYPTAAHRLVVSEVEQTALEEEMRILYVAMTRAQERLILVGSTHDAEEATRRIVSGHDHDDISAYVLRSAVSPLGWLVPALASADRPLVAGDGDRIGDDHLFVVQHHGAEEIASWNERKPTDSEAPSSSEAVAACRPLPPGEPMADGSGEVAEIRSRMDFVYPHLAATGLPAVVGASEAKRLALPTDLEQQQASWAGDPVPFSPPASRYAPPSAHDAAYRGTITHRVLEHLDFAAARLRGGVASELHRLQEAGVLSETDLIGVDREAIEWLVGSALGHRIAEAKGAYRRELPFVAAESAAALGPSETALGEDRAVVRGIVDGVLPGPDGIEILDFKTDTVGAADVASRVEVYRPQMQVYAHAMARIWRRPVTACLLVFLHPRRLVDLTTDGDTVAWNGSEAMT